MAETAYILNITVRNKIATTIDPATVVNGNNDYTVVFDFDSEWDSLSSKTAMFVYGREEQKYKTVTFTGNSCVMPALYNTGYVLIGVFAGDIKTTSAAYVKCIPCIKDNDSTLDTGSGGTIDTGTTDHSQLINRDIADQHPISAITGLENELANKQPSGEYLTQEDLQAATDIALAQAKESGEFDGAAGKSAYAYAQDGGYTGTEEQFAAKLAKEKFANPYALTFTGAVEGSYDGSAPLSVKIPEGGSGEAWELLYETTLTENAATFSHEIPACSKVKIVIFPGSDVSGWKRIIINGISYPTLPNSMAANQAYFVSIDTLTPPYITAATGIYDNPSVNGINGGYKYSSYAMIGDSITKIGCGTAEMLVTGAIIKIWGVRK